MMTTQELTEIAQDATDLADALDAHNFEPHQVTQMLAAAMPVIVANVTRAGGDLVLS